MFHRLNGNLLLLNTLKGLLQLRNLLFAFLTLKFQNAEVLLVFAFVLQFDTVLQHDCSKEFFLLLYPQVTLCQRTSLTGDTLIGKSLFQRNTGGQSSLASGSKGNEINM